MNNSNVTLIDLPDEILVMIFKKLHNLDVLYSLVGVNKKLDNVSCDISFTRSIDLMKISSDKMKNDRFSMHILPRIHNKIECLTIQACFLPRVIHTNNYFKLHKLHLMDLKLKMAPDIFFSMLSQSIPCICAIRFFV